MTQHFGVWGFITGGALPDREVRLADATIRRLSGKHLEFARSKQRSFHYLQGVEHGHAVHPSTMYVYSPWVVQWLIAEAPSMEAAVDSVRKEKLPRLLLALNSLASGPYRVQVMRVGVVDASGAIGHEVSPYSTSVMQTFGPPARALTAEEGRAVDSRLQLLVEGQEIRKVAGHFQEGHLLLDLRGGLPASMAAAAFTAFHRFIEGVVQARYRKTDVTDEERERQKLIIEGLVSKLQNQKRRGKHANAVAEAARQLAATESHGFPARLAAVVQGLDGAHSLTEELQRFYAFRNRYFAHTGMAITDALALEWSSRAAGACRELLELWLVAEGAGILLQENEPSVTLASGAQDYPVRFAELWLDTDEPGSDLAR